MWPLLLLCAFFCGTGLVFVYSLGYFKPVKFIEKEFPGMHVIYHQHVGSYQQIQGFFMFLGKKFKGNFKKSNMGFGIYYDDPDRVKNVKQSRCVGGIVLSKEEVDSESTKKFLEENRGFHYKYLTKSPALWTYFPFINYASF